MGTQQQAIPGYMSQKAIGVNNVIQYATVDFFSIATLPGLAFWVDAQNFASLSFSGSNVTQWNDLSGNARHATQATSGARPIYSSSGINSFPALSFSGSQNLTMSLSVPTTWIAVVRPSQTNGGSGYRGIAASSGSGSMLLSSVNGGNWGTFGTTNRPSTVSLAADTNYIVMMDSKTGGVFYTNGASSGSYADTTGQGSAHVGGSIADLQGFFGLIGEAIATTTDLSPTNRVNLFASLSSKWGIAVS